MKFFLILLLFIISCKESTQAVKKGISPVDNIEITNKLNTVNISGDWIFTNQEEGSDVPIEQFTLKLFQVDKKIKGQYCAIARSGAKIDCEPGENFNINGTIEDGISYVKFYSFFGTTKDLGEAEIRVIDENTIKWKIKSETEGECYAPRECILKRKNITQFKTNQEVSKSDYLYNKRVDPKNVIYKEVSKNSIYGLEKYSCDNNKFRYLELPNKEDIRLLLIPQDCGDFDYRFYLLTIKDNKVISDLYVEGEWYEPDDEENTEYTSFSINKNFNIEVTTKINNEIKVKQYSIDSKGKIKGI